MLQSSNSMAGAAATETTALVLRDIGKAYGTHWAVRDLNISVEQGEFVTLLGPSGCGKTTTLSIIAGFIEPDAGKVLLRGKPLVGLPPFKRGIGVVFQDYALFPHMSVAQNVGYGLRARRVPKPEIDARVEEMLDLVRLGGLGSRSPQALSGGQRQRVALARALVINPEFLLLDEPLSNLDLKLREEMRLEVVRLQRQLSVPTIFVTHDQSEALAMSDRIAVMNEGQVEQIGSPKEIYEAPVNRFVAQFIGSMNLISATVVEGASAGSAGLVEFADSSRVTATFRADSQAGQQVSVAVRPERCAILRDAAMSDGTAALAATITHIVYLGSKVEIHVKLAAGGKAVAEAIGGSADELEAGQDVKFLLSPQDCTALPV